MPHHSSLHLTRRKSVISLFALFLVAIVLGLGPSHADTGITSRALIDIHQKIAAQHVNVGHMSLSELSALQNSASSKFLILDVREESEHVVSHIAGAIRVKPGLSTSEFARIFGDRLQGRTIVLYCSVGVRSTRLAARINTVAQTASAKVYNLAGGIFNWHNQSRPLTSNAGQTDRVHPYSWRWSGLLERRNLISYKPPRATQ